MTKEELLALRAMMVEVVQEENQKLRAEMKEENQKLRAEMKEENQKLRTEMKEENQKLLMNIVDVVESQATKLSMQYEHNVDGRLKALDEEIAIIHETVKDHEQRIYNVERKVGLAI